jgi:hypothetical protein
MEASEKQQLGLDETSVRALADRIEIEHLTVTDERAARVVRERSEAGQPQARTVADAIEIGARVLDREDVAVETDFVRREYEQAMADHRREAESQQRELTEQIQKEIRRAFGDDAGKGALAEALDAHSQELTGLVEETFGDGSDSAVPKRIQQLIEERNREFLNSLSADDDLNPLRPILTSLSKWTSERRESQDRRDEKLEDKLDQLLREAAALAGVQRGSEELSAAIEAGTQKGLDFEDAAHEEIERIAAARGDVAHHVGAISNEAGSKKGDTLVEIGGADGPPRARVIFEAKDKRLSRNDAWKELDAELQGRDARFAVLLVSGESKLPAKTQELHEYQGNKMIVILDKDSLDPSGLELVYRYACARALMASEGELEVDAAGVGTLIERAAAALKRGKGVRDSLTRATQGIDGAREGFDAIVADVEECLDQVDDLISPAVSSD